MNTPHIAITTVSLAFVLNAGQALAKDNVFVRSKDKIVEVTVDSKDVVKGVGKDIGFGFRDAWRRVSTFVTGKKQPPKLPNYQPAPYTPPPYGYTSQRGTNYAAGYGPPIPYDQSRRVAPVQGETAYVVPSPPNRRPSPNIRKVPPRQKQPATPPVLTEPKPSPPVSKPKPEPKPEPKPKPEAEPEKTVSAPATPPTKPAADPNTPSGKQPQFAIPIPGKSGMVYSPFTIDKKPVDVRNIPSGTVVKDPYTNQLFLVP
ncbi:MAG: hypothetical protein P8J87_15880 [Verrucomicrobiales bacterium]|nr:hypothetical protein [Verrucomicrobiales bacterium]